jgi:O-antigen/teichoic acid export membrane protein
LPTETATKRALSKRATWIMADQAVSSLSNAGLSIVIARTVSPGEYGAFAVAFSIYTFLVAISQASAGQVVMIRYSASDEEVRDRANAGAAGTSVVLGLVSAAVLGMVALPMQLPLRSVLLAMGVLLPGLMLQDTWRTIFVSRGTPSQAFTNDVLWIVLQIVMIGLLLVLGVDRVVWYLLAWGAAALGAAVYGIRQAGVRPRLRLTKPFLLNHRDVSVPSVANALAILGANQVAILVIAAVASVEAVGALRGAQTLLGPLNIVGFALSAFAVPEIIRHDLSRRGLVTVALALSGVLVAVDLAWGAVLLLLPDNIGFQLLGETWPAARAALPGMVVFTAAIGATVGASAVMRALARPNYAFWVSAMLGPLVLALSVSGAWLYEAPGAAWGFATAALLVIPLAWRLLALAVRRGRAEAEVGI